MSENEKYHILDIITMNNLKRKLQKQFHLHEHQKNI